MLGLLKVGSKKLFFLVSMHMIEFGFGVSHFLLISEGDMNYEIIIDE